MRIQQFTKGPAKQLDAMTPDDVFYGFDDKLWVRVFDSPINGAIMRLEDNHYDAVAPDDTFVTTLAILEPLS